MRKRHHALRQSGVAVVTALLLTALAVSLISGLFWRQQVEIRALENQQAEIQMRWTLLDSLDWAAMVLRDAVKKTNNVDYVGQPWSLPITELHIDGYDDASLSRQIIDAQSRYNLTNLVNDGVVDKDELAIFRRLLANLQLPVPLAEAVASTMARNSQPFLQVDDLLAVKGVTPEIVEHLRNYVVVLPVATPVNLNTAPALVFSACFETLTPTEASALIVSRAAAYFRNAADFSSRLAGKFNISTDSKATSVSFSSHYFLVESHIRIGRASRRTLALLQRNENQSIVLWTRTL